MDNGETAARLLKAISDITPLSCEAVADLLNKDALTPEDELSILLSYEHYASRAEASAEALRELLEGKNQ